MDSRALQVTARYKEALDAFSKALTIAPANKSLLDQYGRLNLVGQQIKALPEYRTDASQSALHGGILAFLAEKDVEAVQLVSEALRIKPDDIDAWIERQKAAAARDDEGRDGQD